VITHPNPNPNPNSNPISDPDLNSAMPYINQKIQKLKQYLPFQLICDDLW